MQNRIGGLVSRHGLFAQVLVGLCEALHLAEASVQGHGRVGRILGHIQISRPAQLLLYHQRLLQQLHTTATAWRRYEKQKDA